MKIDFTKPIIIEYKKDDSKSIGIILGTHGDEVVGLEVLNRIRAQVGHLQIKGKIKFIIANPLAVSLGVRFIYKNLNTEAFPGNLNGDFEDILAFNIKKEIEGLDYLIDLHSTNQKIEPYVITRKLMNEVAKFVPIKKIVLFDKKDLPVNTLIDYGKSSVALEIGPHILEENFQTYSTVVMQTLVNLGFLTGEKKILKDQTCYKYTGDLSGLNSSSVMKLKNFKLIKKGSLIGKDNRNKKIFAKEDFVPFLISARSRASSCMCAVPIVS